MPDAWTIVGVDCATQEERMGLARGQLGADNVLRVERVTLGTAGESAAASVSHWIAGQPQFVLALAAPLGWPERLGGALSGHSAGEPLCESADALFRRETDKLVHKAVGKQPPDVGADRVARTARAALALLSDVRALARQPIPLAWQQARESGAIEVYPAATLLAHGVSSTAYKAGTTQGRKARADILERLSAHALINVARDVMIQDANLFDAMLCVLAGADFAQGLCVEPLHPDRARKEGHIWFRGTGQGSLFGQS